MSKNIFKTLIRLLIKFKESINEMGFFQVIQSGIGILIAFFKIILNPKWSEFFVSNPPWLWYYRIFKSWRTFTFQGKTYKYFYHMINQTWKCERTVEIPIIIEIVKNYNKNDVLEVGNVLSQYFYFKHDIVDKYEKVEGVINQDIVDFRPSKKYELIISISTLEHVGWDETPIDSLKILKAIDNLKSLLTRSGTIIVTLPFGGYPYLDKLLKEDKIPFFKKFCLKRVSRDNKWKEVNWKEILNSKYGHPFPYSNGLIIGIIKRDF